jgi:hypothetical protein
VANEVVIVGDAFFASSHEVTGFLEELARQSGALDVGERYRDASQVMGNGLAYPNEGILDQYMGANSEAPAKVVIMNGGGADALLGSCDTLDSTCPMIQDASAALARLYDTMATDGVEAVVFVAYPNPQPADVRDKMDLLRPELERRCVESPVPCHLVDLRPVFEGHYDEYIQDIGLNPTTAGSEAAADAIWSVMQDSCLAQ